jgi:hypothetical protein
MHKGLKRWVASRLSPELLRVNYFLRNKSTIELINVLQKQKSKVRTLTSADYELVILKKGGNNQGTWFHEDLSIYFAQWLNPKFGVCCPTYQSDLQPGFLRANSGWEGVH